MYYRARHYDAALGQFIQRDPIGFAAGDLTLYAYTWNDPYNWTDPSGLASSRNAGKLTVGVMAMAIRAGAQMSAGSGSLAMNIRNALAAMAIIGVLANTEGDDADDSEKPADGPHEGDPPKEDPKGNPIPVAPDLPDGWDGKTPPADGWEWRGTPGSQPGDGKGNWYNPETGTSVGPDFGHGEPIGPHVDVKIKGGWGSGYRLYPGTPGLYPKRKR